MGLHKQGPPVTGAPRSAAAQSPAEPTLAMVCSHTPRAIACLALTLLTQRLG